MKKILSLILALFVFLSFTFTASANEESCVHDNADLLSGDEWSAIFHECERIMREYRISVLILTTMSTSGEDIHTYAEDFYNEYAPYEDGLVFVINLNNNEVGNRDFYTYYCGTVYDTFGYEAYDSDYGTINSAVLPYLANEDYYSAFSEYLRLTEGYISGEITYGNSDGYYDDGYSDEYYGEESYYYDSTPSSSGYFIKEIIVIIAGVAVALLVTSIMKNKMNTAVIKNEASDYMKAGSMNVTRRLDVFTHRHVTKTAKPKNNSSNSGSRSGGGFSGGGGGGGRSGGGGGKF